MKLSYQILRDISRKFGTSFYLMDLNQFRINYSELLSSFRKYYNKTNIAYSYKTNYAPAICKVVNELGGYAEVVSSMEYKVAKKLGVLPSNIYFNGPYKDYYEVQELLISGGIVNVDSIHDFNQVEDIAKKNMNQKIKIGIRINFDINDGVTSRFGFDLNGKSIELLEAKIKVLKNVDIVGIHTHFATRSLISWENRVFELGKVLNQFRRKYSLKFISLGGGLYGKMHEDLKTQFSSKIPSYNEYAKVVAKGFADIMSEEPDLELPELLIEPGSALVGDILEFVTSVYSIKNVREKNIATLRGSIFNINPLLNTKNPPIRIYSNKSKKSFYKDLNFAGYTCIESDYLFKNYTGPLSVGDFVVFGNVGSYSIVLKPPFILPNFPVLKIDNKKIETVKRQESFEDVFRTYIF